MPDRDAKLSSVVTQTGFISDGWRQTSGDGGESEDAAVPRQQQEAAPMTSFPHLHLRRPYWPTRFICLY